MNKIVSMLLLAIFMAVSSPSAMAYWEEGKPQENQTVANIKTLAIAAPLYTEKKGYPTLEEYINILNTRGAKVSPKKYKVVPYDVIAKGILQTTGKDLYTLNRIASVRVFKPNTLTRTSFPQLRRVNARYCFLTCIALRPTICSIPMKSFSLPTSLMT